ncbi:hypothetical protein G7054_g7053 [Neopestalotiopsis clavispora]|nr:hypothetical protein E8E14_001315 [Neopestalotiopsis sp. 37M]KAF7533490.1 hypothetical protein G7054_g7053 [Neopestalotiopsis clavispora]
MEISFSDARKELFDALAVWREYVFEVEYKACFDMFDQHARLRGEGSRITPVVEARNKFPYKFIPLDAYSNGWADEVKKLIEDEEWEENGRKVSWKKKGVDGWNEFLNKYCPRDETLRMNINIEMGLLASN